MSRSVKTAPVGAAGLRGRCLSPRLRFLGAAAAHGWRQLLGGIIALRASQQPGPRLLSTVSAGLPAGVAWLRVCVLGPTVRPALWASAAPLGGPQKATTARTSTFSILSAERQTGFASRAGGGGTVGGAAGLQFRRPEKRLCRTRAKLGKAPSACAGGACRRSGISEESPSSGSSFSRRAFLLGTSPASPLSLRLLLRRFRLTLAGRGAQRAGVSSALGAS